MDKVKERMIEKGYTTQTLADTLGLDNTAVWRWVNGRAKPRAKHAAKLVELGILDSADAEVDLLKAELQALKSRADELRECLFWYVDTDESTEEDDFYWEGKQKALRALGLK